MKLYRINKVAKPGGVILKKKDVLASSDHEALHRAEESPECPICDVLHNGKLVGQDSLISLELRLVSAAPLSGPAAHDPLRTSMGLLH